MVVRACVDDVTTLAAGRKVTRRRTSSACIAASMALMAALAARGANPTLVLGVKLDPFQAHCWVELAGTVLNDAPDHVRPFTPIRRV